jgi:3',5'-cyclic AMP phosphodiesterase CpdA
LKRALRRAGLHDWWEFLEDGTAGHDTFAPFVFTEFLAAVTVRDPVWSTHPTWLVDTGDQTTFGDAPSSAGARKLLASFAKSARPSLGGALTNLRGNHDAWPEGLPFSSTQAAIARHTSEVLADHYAIGAPQAALRTRLSGGGEIQLYSLDTVDPGRLANSLARGSVDTSQLDRLDELVAAGAGNAPCLRILATHHPVHYPPKRPKVAMVLANEAEVGRRLDRPPPAIQIVLSGHTHALFPAHGKLPPTVRQCLHSPLGQEQCQLVVGTLMQTDVLDRRGAHAQQCELLRFYQDPALPQSVLMTRALAARNPMRGQLRYELVELPRGGCHEELLVEI